MDKRFQVFVSSTFRDLVDERKEVMQALLELDCIPSGMELFQAADEDQWSLIKRVIDDCDYYMVIIAGRYGSLGRGGLSYTEMEYRYALEQGKPVIAFLHEDPGKLPSERVEADREAQEKLASFRTFCETRVVKYWSGAQGLGSAVSRSIVRLIKDRPAVGWIRGNAVASEEANKEILSLRQKVDSLEAKLRSNATSRPEGTDDLLQDGDLIPAVAVVGFQHETNVYSTEYFNFNINIPWSVIFNKVGPRMLEEIPEGEMDAAVDAAFSTFMRPKLAEDKKYKNRKIKSVQVQADSFQKIKVQMIALGLVAKGDKKRAVSDSQVYWKLTPYGETKTMAAIAMKRPERELNESF